MSNQFFFLFLIIIIINLISADNLTVTINPNTNPVQKPAGDQISLVCSVKGAKHDKPGIIWKKHGGLDRTGNVEIRKLDDWTIGLVIRNSTIEDSGVYACQAQLGSKVVTSQIDVVVFEDLVFIDKQLHFGQILATASINISCEVTTRNEHVITYWTRHGKQIIEGKNYKFYNAATILEIKSYQPEVDAGQYTCEVFHVSSGSSTTKTVTLGTNGEKYYVACQQMCNSFCSDFQNKFLD